MFSAIDRVNSAMRWVGVVSVLLLLLIVAGEVFMRFVFNSPSGWTIELSVTIQLVYGFLCAGYVLRQGAHITLESIFEYVQPKTRAALLMTGSIMGTFFCCIMAYYSCLMLIASFRLGDHTAFAGWPVFLLKLPVFIGFILLGGQFIVETYKDYQPLKKGNAGDKVKEASQ